MPEHDDDGYPAAIFILSAAAWTVLWLLWRVFR